MNTQQKWLSRKYVLYKLLTSLWFVGAVWLYFYRIYITDSQVGILDGVAFAIGLVAEVPSGVLADKFGRDKMVRLGQFLAGSGLIYQSFGQSLLPLATGQAITMIGVSFVSGADEALFFEKLKFKKDSVDWRKLVTRGSQIALIGTMCATILGGYLHEINPRLPWVFNGIAFITSVLLVWPIKDERKTKARTNVSSELREQLSGMKEGFVEFFRPKLLLYVPIILTVQGLFYTAGWGLLRVVLLDRFHFSPFAGSIVVASCSLLTVGFLSIMHKNAERMSEKTVLTTISLLAGASLIFSIFDVGMLGYIIILALYAGEHLLSPFMSEVLNYRTEENKRATVLSVSSFLRTLPYVALAPIIGTLNTQGNLEYFLLTWTVLIIFAVALYLSLKKKDTQISFATEDLESERIPEL